MAFGLSANWYQSRMVGGDVTIAWVDRGTGQPHAVDYFLESKHQVIRIVNCSIINNTLADMCMHTKIKFKTEPL